MFSKWVKTDANARLLPSTALYYLAVAATLTCFFELWRLLVLLQLRDRINNIPETVILQSFLVGLRFDFCISCYITLPLMVLGSLPMLNIANNKPVRVLNNVLLLLLAAIAFAISLTDIEFFRFFNSRLNSMALEWNETPGFVVSMLWESYPVVRYFLLYAIVMFAFIKTIRWLQYKIFLHRSGQRTPLWSSSISFLVVAAIMLLAMRGRIEEKSPITWGMAYFSEYSFANLLALNPNFTFVRDALYDSRGREKVEETMQSIAFPEAEQIARRLLYLETPDKTASPSRIHRRVTFDPPATDRPNVILIIMESFGSSCIGCLKSKFAYDLSPCFDSLLHEGILFSNIYSTGMHTYAGLLGSIYGHPTMPGKSIMKQVGGQGNFWGLPSILRSQNYETMFFTTHDPQFDNMQGFLMSNEFMHIYSLFDYDQSLKMGTLGVPDHVMFDNALRIIDSRTNKTPFFATLLTASNHGPWQVPDVRFERVPDAEKLKFELDGFKYSDWALGRFIRQLQSNKSFDNTIVLITADNGKLLSPVLDLDLTQYQIPILILGIGSVQIRAQQIDLLGSQTDILPTLMGLLRFDYDDYSFGKDLLSSASSSRQQFVFFSENFTVGYIEPPYYLISRIGGKPSLYDLSDPALSNLTLLLPDITKEYETKALSLFQTAYFNSQRPLHSTE